MFYHYSLASVCLLSVCRFSEQLALRDGQPELFVKLREGVQSLHLEHKCHEFLVVFGYRKSPP